MESLPSNLGFAERFGDALPESPRLLLPLPLELPSASVCHCVECIRRSLEARARQARAPSVSLSSADSVSSPAPSQARYSCRSMVTRPLDCFR